MDTRRIKEPIHLNGFSKYPQITVLVDPFLHLQRMNAPAHTSKVSNTRLVPETKAHHDQPPTTIPLKVTIQTIL